MSTTEEEIVADLDAAAVVLLGAPYVAQRATMQAKLWAVIARAVSNFEPSGGGGGGGPALADTVEESTDYGLPASAGVSAECSRADHTHGSPDMPTAADVGADPAGTAAAAVAALAATLADVALSGDAGDLSGELPEASMPALSGDVSSSPGSTVISVDKIAGVTITGTPAAGQSLVALGSSSATWALLSLALAGVSSRVWAWPLSVGDPMPADTVALAVVIA